MKRLVVLAGCLILFGTLEAKVGISGPAPKGDEKKVAQKIIRTNFPTCKHITSATRLSDGTIAATCSSVEYRIFTMQNVKTGRILEVALNCTAAEELGVSCWH